MTERQTAEGQAPTRPATTTTSRSALWSTITGAVGIFLLGWLLGPIAIWLGVRGRSEAKRMPTVTGSGLAVTGIVLGVLALLIWVAGVYWFWAWG